MRKLLVLFLTICCFIYSSIGVSLAQNSAISNNLAGQNSAIGSQEKSLKNNILPITNVDLYQGQAFVTRSGKVAVNNGEIVVAQLPVAMDFDRLTIKLNGQVISNYKLVRDDANADVVGVEQITKKIDALNDEVTQNQDDIDLLKHQIFILNSIYDSRRYPMPLHDAEKVQASQTTNNNAVTDIKSIAYYNAMPDVKTVQQIVDGSNIIGVKNKEINREIRKLELNNKLLAKEIDKLQKTIDGTNNEDAAINKFVKIIIKNNTLTDNAQTNLSPTNSTNSTNNSVEKIDLSINYLIGGASWQTRYQANLNTGADKVDFSFDAVITQNTGENWQNISLTLFNGMPAQYFPLAPITDSWVIGIPRVDKDQYKNNIVEYEANSPDLRGDVSLARSNVAMAKTSVVYTGFDAKFVVAGKVSINANSQKQKVNITNLLNLPINLLRKYVPEQDAKQVHLVADMENNSGFVWLPGELMLSRDGIYLGKTELTKVQPKDKVGLDFGADPFIVVNVKTDPQFEKSSGIFDKRHVVKRAKIYSIQNNYNKAIKVITLAKLPVAKDANIDVELTDNSTKPKLVDANGVKGLLEWDSIISAKSNAAINFSYQVSYPQDVRYLQGF